MKSAWSFALNFYAPLLVAVFLLCIVSAHPKFINLDSGVELATEISVLGIKIPIPIHLEKTWLLEGVLIIASIACLTRSLTLDFSKYFPKRFHVHVFFDEKGIQNNLATFSAKELAEVKLAKDWEERFDSYNKVVKAGLAEHKRQLAETSDLSELTRNSLCAEGHTHFSVKRKKWLSYHIVESDGELVHYWEVRNKRRQEFSTKFELQKTANNHIRLNLISLLKSPTVLLMPEFKQIFFLEDGGLNAPFNHALIAFTKVYLLPVPHINNTVYLWKLEDGRTIPIGYCIYEDEDAD